MSEIVKCAKCGQSNRVPSLASGKAAVCGKCRAPLPSVSGGGKPITITDADFASSIAGGAVVVDFWAPWCGPCRTIGPILEQIAAERNDVRIAKLNVDENPRTSSKFGVQSIPLLVFFRDGVERGRLVGAVPRPQIESAIRQYLG